MNWTILEDNGSLNRYKGIQYQLIMGLLMDIKVFNANLIRFVLIFNSINMNSIMIKSFFEVS